MKIEQLHRQPGHLIRRAHQTSVALFAQELAGFDLTSVQFAALVAIGDRPGVDATRVAEAIGFDKATLGSVLGRLMAKGLVDRKASALDARVKTLSLTKAGAALVETVEAKVQTVQQRLLEPLTGAERELLVELLGKLLEAAPEAAPRRAARAPQDLPPRAS